MICTRLRKNRPASDNPLLMPRSNDDLRRGFRDLREGLQCAPPYEASCSTIAPMQKTSRRISRVPSETSRCPACLDRLFDVKAILQDGRKSLRGSSPKLRSSSAGEQPEVVAPRIPRGNGTVARIGMTDDINQHPRAPPSFGALVRTASAAAAVLFTDYHRLPPVAVPG